jgi:hypothetical protein
MAGQKNKKPRKRHVQLVSGLLESLHFLVWQIHFCSKHFSIQLAETWAYLKGGDIRDGSFRNRIPAFFPFFWRAYLN